MTLREKAARGVLWSVIQKWGTEMISFLILLILSRLLAPEAFGVVALALVFTEIMDIFLNQGFTAAIVQRDDLEPAHLDTAFWTTVLIGVLLTGVGIASSGLVAAVFDEPQLAPVLRWLSLVMLFSGLSSTQMALLQRTMSFKKLAARSMTAKTVGGIVGVGLALAGCGVWSLVAQKLAAGIAAIIVLWRASDWRPSFHVSTKHYRELFSFGIVIAAHNIMKVLVHRADDLLIGYFLGSTLLGYYSIGHRLLLVMSKLVTGIINAVAFPAFSRLRQNPERLRRAYYNVTQYTSLIAFPVFVGMIPLATEFVLTLFGEKWAPSIPVVQVLALLGILHSLLAFNGSVLRACGKPSWELGIMLLNAACGIIGALLAVRWGIVAVGASFVIAGYLLAPVSYAAARRLIDVDLRTYLRMISAPALASLVMIAVVAGLNHVLLHQGLDNAAVRLAAGIAAGGLAYALCIALVARPLSREVLELARLVTPGGKRKAAYRLPKTAVTAPASEFPSPESV
jgi:PST family polysaccharide transporter